MSTILGNPITLGGGGGNELIVTAPTGSTVTATKGSITKTATEKNGTWTFKGLEAGDWTVTAVQGSESTSSVVTVSTETVTLSFLSASLTPKSGVTYTNGISGISAEKMSLYAELISNNASITNATSVVYIDEGANHYKVSIGDQITLALNGTNYAFDVIGFNHDTLTTASAYGSNTATGKAGITFQMHDLFSKKYSMYNTGSNAGGWKNCYMRNTVMQSIKNNFLPADWVAIVKLVNKASGKGGGSSSGTETVPDDCFLLSEIEVFGSIKYSVSGEGTQYAYYKSGNSKVKNHGGSASIWWERSPRPIDNYNFCCVTEDGATYSHMGSNSFGVAFGFCV